MIFAASDLPTGYTFVSVINALFLTTLCLHSLFQLWQVFEAWLELKDHRRHQERVDSWWLMTSDVTIPISMLVPAYNEETTIVENIRSLLSLHYPDFEVIVINDGSTDRTLAVVIEQLKLEPINRVFHREVEHQTIRNLYGSPRYPRLIVIDKENGGKSDALNAGINVSRCPLFCAVDADSILDADALLRVVRPFIEHPEEMIAVGGRIRVVNGCLVRSGQVIEYRLPTRLLPLLQTVEYVRAFLISRLAWSRLNAMLIISGAFGVFKRSAAVKVGGYSHNTVGEDMEIVIKLHRYAAENSSPLLMRYVPDPVCWTEAPESLRVLRRQRTRWQRGMLEGMVKHRRMIFSRKYGAVGMLGMGYCFLFDILGPIIELLGLIVVPVCWGLGLLSLNFLVAYLMLTFSFGIFISVASLFLEEVSIVRTQRPRDLVILTLCAIAENFGYRQLNTLWRIEGLIQFLQRKKGWGTMTRSGFHKPAPTEPATKT